MTDERPASIPPALGSDEIALDDEVTAPPAEVAPKPPPPRPLPPVVEPPRRPRARMTLRIPDDEVGGPTPRAMPAAEPHEPAEPAEPIQATRIISVGPPPMPAEAEEPQEPQDPAGATPAAPTVIDREDSWTPFQPTVADSRPTLPLMNLEMTGEHAAPVSEEIPVTADDDEAEAVEIDVPVGPPPMIRKLVSEHPSRQRTEPEMREVREVRVDAPAMSKPPSPPSPRRVSEPGEAPEVDAEDLVSVESLPTRAGGALPPMRPRAKSVPPAPPSNPPPPPPPPRAPAGAPASVRASSPAPPMVGSVSPPPPAASPPSPPSPPAAPPPPAAAAPSPLQAAKAPPRVIVPQPGIAPPAMTEAAAQRRRNRPWWEELFNDDYLRAMGRVTDRQIATEVSFIEDSLGVARDGMLLDLGCGTGLHAIELTRRGYRVVGFDLSLAMLARAADEALEREQTLNFLHGDMREMTFDEVFDGVYCWNTTFGFFDEEKNAQVLGRVHRSLKPRGVFLLDVVNRDYIARQSPSLAWFEGDGCVCMDEMNIDWITSRMKVKRTMMFDDGRSKEIEYSIRVYSLHELGKLLHEQGFRVAEVSGRTAMPGVFFGVDSPRALILAEKR